MKMKPSISKSSIHAKSKHGFLTSYFFAESGNMEREIY
jgi:hypothetical protein